MPTIDRLHINKLQRPGLGPVELRLRTGECTCLSGPSGAGKTLLLRAIADLDPSDGEIFLDGTSRNSVSPESWRSAVGLLSAESYWWAARVGDHFTDSGRDAVKKLGFTSAVMEWSVERLSSGERQRLALLRLLEHSPKVLLLDEPTANLDPLNSQRVETLLQEIQHQNGAALLWVSHDSHQIARVAQHHFVMDSGQLAPEPCGVPA